MIKPESVSTLTRLGRVRLSTHFYMRDMLYSEVANLHQMQNIPERPDRAIAAGSKLCNDLLEPLRATFGHVSIRSAYRSHDLNRFCAEKGFGCARDNCARHTWDCTDKNGYMGATACIVIPWFVDYLAKHDERSWTAMAWWMHDHRDRLPYSELCFYPVNAAFNIRWRGDPKTREAAPEYLIKSFAKPKGTLTRPALHNFHGEHSEEYPGFPELRLY